MTGFGTTQAQGIPFDGVCCPMLKASQLGQGVGILADFTKPFRFSPTVSFLAC